jgi:hypothetical protein
MPTLLHNTFISKLEKEIEKRLHNLADADPDARAFIVNIETVSGEVKFPILDQYRQGNNRHEPDSMFIHEDARWPGVVMEVSYSQKKKSLVDLAENYILGSYGGVNMVVGLDLDYKKSKKATISIWRLKRFTKNDGEEGEVVQTVNCQVGFPLRLIAALTNTNKPFRDDHGNPVPAPASSLKLALKDFAVRERADNVPDISVVIDSETLCELLGKAESWYQRMAELEELPIAKPFKRKFREKTPPEELSCSDEKKFREAERRVRKKSERQDRTYGGERTPANSSSEDSV